MGAWHTRLVAGFTPAPAGTPAPYTRIWAAQTSRTAGMLYEMATELVRSEITYKKSYKTSNLQYIKNSIK
jgi:hypothetical protein